MKVVMLALGIYSREGGMERFNRRVLDSLGQLTVEGTIDEACAVVLWDRREDAARAPSTLRMKGAGASKVRFALDALAVVRKVKPDVVLYGHILLVPLAVFARLVGRRSIHVLIAHGYEVWDRPRAVTRSIVTRGIDLVAAVSAFTEKRMADAYGIPQTRFRRLINAVDIDEAPRVPSARSKARAEGFRILTVSRLNNLDKAKHVDKIILALPEIIRRCPRTELLVVGEGELRNELEDLAVQNEVAQHIQFLGNVDDATREALYASSDLFVLPSTQEGFGIVYLEAWKHRLAVVAGSDGAAPEVVRHQKEGIVVDPTPEAIAHTVTNLLEDPEERARLGQSGYERLRSSYTGAHFRRTLLQMLRSAVELGGKRVT